MKKILFVLLVFSIVFASCKKKGCMDTFANNYDSKATQDDGSCEFPLQKGDSLQGGIVFYLDGNGGGLIAAPIDQSAGAEWGCFGTLITGADGTTIGTGNQNTTDIEAGCTAAGTAADICANLTLGGYSDWFLPSKDALNLMWTNLADSDGDGNNTGPSDPSNVGGFMYANYWSCTEGDSYVAWGQSFSDGAQTNGSKASSIYVRAIRAF
tara:strand:+ start:30 stop:659 length:630 start_codon:yes stop_codon:yes gene_type:complete